MPEGDTILRTALALDRSLSGKRVASFESPIVKLARAELAGRRVTRVEARGKNLLVRFDDGSTLQIALADPLNPAAIDELGCDFLRIALLSYMCIEGCVCRVRQLCVCHQSRGSSILARQLNDALDRFAIGPDSDSAISHPLAGSDCRGGGSLIGRSEILRIIHYQCGIWH